MSTSAFHRAFQAVTALSRSVHRLQGSWLPRLTGVDDVATVATALGTTASQFPASAGAGSG